MVTRGYGLLIFDGDCGFCTWAAQWVARGWRPGPRAAPWQQLEEDQLRDLGLSKEEAGAAAWWIDGHGQRFKGHRAMAKSLLAGSGWRRVGGALLSTPPLSWGAAGVYPLITRYRYRLPGGTPACRARTGPLG